MKKILAVIAAVGLLLVQNVASVNAKVDWDDLPTDLMPVVRTISEVDWDDLPTDQMPA